MLLVAYGQNVTYSQRLLPGFSVLSLTCILIPIFAKIGGATGFWLCNMTLVFNGLAGGAAQGTIYGMAAAFPPQYMAAVMFGNGLSGIGSNILRAIVILIWPAADGEDSAFKATLTLFMIAFGIEALCALAQLSLTKNPYANHFLKKIQSKPSAI